MTIERTVSLSLFLAAVALVAFGNPAAFRTEAASVGHPPDVAFAASATPIHKCLCSGNCDCTPVCLCKVPDECQPPKVSGVFQCAMCGGSGRLDCECDECGGTGKVGPPILPVKQAAPLYTQPKSAPKPAAVQSYSSCANGSCGSGNGPLRRLFGRRR